VRVDRELVVLPDAESVARRGAEVIGEAAAAALADRRRFAIAVSGGRTPLAMLAQLSGIADGARGGIWQVDERVAPDGDPDRNLTGLLAALPAEWGEIVHAMPVTDPDVDAAAQAYGASLPSFDLVHLGLGEDGHTASLVPGDPVLDVRDRDVAVTAAYRGRRRMTFTFALLDRVPFVLWVVTGAAKARVLPRLLAGDGSIPAGRVGATRQLVLADPHAASVVG
jgi:6-phosphogluconolactonase/glucosamine-6-phosphate isomerase/deaminase